MRSERARPDGQAAPRRGRRRRRVHVGLAVGVGGAVAVELAWRFGRVRPGRVWVRALDPAGPEGGRWPALGAALAELGDPGPLAGATVHVALLPPFGRTKVLRVPPVRRGELRALVAGSIRRFFLDGPADGLADARRLRGAGAPARALAAVADAAVVEAVHAELSAAGFRIGGTTTAAAALIEAALWAAPAWRRGATELRVVAGAWRERVRLERGEPREIHPLPPDGVPLPAPEGEGEPDRRITLGPDDAEPAGMPALRRELAALRREPAAVAALGAALLSGAAPQVVPHAVREGWRGRAARRTVRLASLAAALVIAACGVHAWGLARELASVRAARRAIAARVAQAVEARDAVAVVRGHLEAIAHAESSRQAWAERLAMLAAVLPDSAHLWTFAADSSTLRLEGLAESASAVVMALDSSGWFRDVELAAPVVREPDGPRERFTVAAVIAEAAPGRGAGAAVAPPPDTAVAPPSDAAAPGRREGL
ncbi:MAG TPA: PilN domain-containing protein [Longimicrobiales bacterium]